MLRIITVLVLLFAGATFSFCPAATAEPQVLDRCCGDGRDEADRPAAEGCAAVECGCVTCVTVLLPTQSLTVPDRLHRNPYPLPDALPPLAGYLASIDYPPEIA